MGMTSLWIGIAIFIVLYAGLAAFSIAVLPRKKYPHREFADITQALAYDDARNKLRQTIAQIVIGSGFVFTFVAAIVGHNITVLEGELKKQSDDITAYINAGKLEGDARLIFLDRLARISPQGFHDAAYRDVIRTIPHAKDPQCEKPDFDNSRTTLALTLLANRIEANDGALSLLLERKCLAGVRLDHWGEKVTRGTGLRWMNLSGSSLVAADLTGMDLSNSTMMGVAGCDYDIDGWSADVEAKGLDLRDRNTASEPKYPDLRRKYTLHFIDTKLRNVRFDWACLSGADFRKATLKGAQFHGANVSRADFRDTDILPSQLAMACYGRTDFSAEKNAKDFPLFDGYASAAFRGKAAIIPLCSNGEQ
ncbi:pentapeptide repeat-containing protein [Xanthobacter dioxanivorans]|uniref:Pentapeptide repeat-containing protein n=1 Tax=Xanthobacter dioxanivorans TaxID=2528964 RepID=A0A974PUE7_9HYPH|nr:pentapeptide repeat-containing protein [Xanthobacter dioxanivorans]QRG09275.1 pentapeptide repeat-containing protein [Xanthobacter dioxanivorans]